MKKSAAHFNISIDAQPDYWGTRVFLAEEWAIKEDNRQLFEEQLNYVLAGDPNVIPYIKPENACEQRERVKWRAEQSDAPRSCANLEAARLPRRDTGSKGQVGAEPWKVRSHRGVLGRAI